MNPNLWPQIIIAVSTLLAAILGYVLAGINEARRDRRAAERERTARAEDRDAAAADARHAFQRQTLLELQDAIQLMARLTGRTLHFDRMQARQDRYTQLPENYSEEMHGNGTDVIRLRNRILDPLLRAEIEEFEAASHSATNPRVRLKELDYDAREAFFDDLDVTFGSSYARIMEHLGIALRTELNWASSSGAE